MEVSSLSYHSYARYFDTTEFGEPGELEAEQDPLGGMANDSPIDKLNDARNGSLEAAGLGKAGRELSEDSALGGLARALGRDILAEGEALGRGDNGMNLPGFSSQDRLGAAIGKAAGATGGSISMTERGGTFGGIMGCALGIAFTKSLPGCVPGAVIGGAVGGAIGATIDISQERSKASGAAETPSKSTGSTTEKTKSGTAAACDPLTQSCPCPGSGGMGDDQEGQATAADPVMNTIQISRRAKNGDGKAATVLSARGGNAAEFGPAWTRNSDAREGQGKSHHDGDALRKGIGQVASRLEREDGAQPGGVIPPHSFAKSVAARAANPVIQPLPM